MSESFALHHYDHLKGFTHYNIFDHIFFTNEDLMKTYLTKANFFYNSNLNDYEKEYNKTEFEDFESNIDEFQNK